MISTEPALTDSKDIIDKVLKGEISWVCTNCAEQFSKKQPYEYPYTAHEDTCDICGETKSVGPAVKLFGYYRSF